MCNKIKSAIEYTVDLINNNINRDVQEQCANRLYRVYIYIAAMRMMRIVNVSQFIKLSHVEVMRPSLSLGT